MRRGTKRLSEDRRSPREDSPEREKLGCGLRFYLMMAVAVSVFAFGLTVISVYAPGLIRPRPPSQISTSDATPPAAAAVVDSEDPEGPPPPGLLAPAVDSTPLGQASADGSAGAEEPQSFAHEEDPIPFGHEEIDRPLSGRGCTFRLCNQQSGQWRVGGVRRTTLPLVYIVIPHRNRLDNMARLLSSLVNATSPAQRACMCVIVTDFNTSTTAIAPWKNVHCLVSYRPEYNIWMDDEAYYRGKKLTRGELKSQASTYASAPECPDVSLQREELRAANRGGWRSVSSAFPPVHLDVAGLTGRQALRYTLSFYDGESAIVDGNAYVHNPKIAFSRAGGIMGGFDAIQTPVGASLVFVCDADVIIRPGFFEELVDVPVAGSIVFYPIVWSMCWGTVLEDAPHRSNWRSSAKGGWRPGGAGMVAGYLQDFRSVGGMREMIDRNKWGQEDIQMYRKLEKKFNISRRAAPYLVHMYHSRVKEWGKSPDGISMGPAIGPLGKHVCVRSGTCTCPPGTGPRDIEAAILDELGIKVKIDDGKQEKAKKATPTAAAGVAAGAGAVAPAVVAPAAP